MKDILISFLIALVIGCFINSYLTFNDSNKANFNPDLPTNNQVDAGNANLPRNDSSDVINKQPNITNQNVYNNNNPGNNPMLHGNLK